MSAAPHRVVIADDEPLGRERLHLFLSEHPDFRIVAECAAGDEALATIARLRPQLAFLDVRMPGLTGIEVAQALLDRDIHPLIVFVTAYDEFALQGFEVSAVDYLLKPVDAERLALTLKRVTQRLQGTLPAPVGDDLRALLEMLRAGPHRVTRFLVRTRRGHYFVKTSDIEAATAEGNYLTLVAGGRTHLIRETMRSFEMKVTDSQFLRIHRSIIVNLDHVARIEPLGHGAYRLTTRSGQRYESSRTFGDRLRTLFG